MCSVSTTRFAACPPEPIVHDLARRTGGAVAKSKIFLGDGKTPLSLARALAREQIAALPTKAGAKG